MHPLNSEFQTFKGSKKSLLMLSTNPDYDKKKKKKIDALKLKFNVCIPEKIPYRMHIGFFKNKNRNHYLR